MSNRPRSALQWPHLAAGANRWRRGNEQNGAPVTSCRCVQCARLLVPMTRSDNCRSVRRGSPAASAGSCAGAASRTRREAPRRPAPISLSVRAQYETSNCPYSNAADHCDANAMSVYLFGAPRAHLCNQMTDRPTELIKVNRALRKHTINEHSPSSTIKHDETTNDLHLSARSISASAKSAVCAGGGIQLHSG